MSNNQPASELAAAAEIEADGEEDGAVVGGVVDEGSVDVGWIGNGDGEGEAAVMDSFSSIGACSNECNIGNSAPTQNE